MHQVARRHTYDDRIYRSISVTVRATVAATVAATIFETVAATAVDAAMSLSTVTSVIIHEQGTECIVVLIGTDVQSLSD